MNFDPASAAIAFITSLVVVGLLGGPTIAMLTRLKLRQNINADAPQGHQAKQGTPAMGGLLFLFGVAAAVAVLWATGRLPRQLQELRPMIGVLVVFALHLGLGFIDDYMSVTRGKSLGLKARYKLTGQLLIAAAFAVFLWATALPEITTQVAVWHGDLKTVPDWAYYPLVALVMMMMSNFTNLADGLDGLAAGLALLAFGGLSFVLLPEFFVLSYVGLAVAGALLGFLFFNRMPARVFMGDTGSLALGSTFTAIAVLGKQELAFLIFALVFLAEGFSVMLQIASFKLTGKRVFKMAPLHHHFELLGWKESQVVTRFWLAGALALGLGVIAALKLAPWRT